MQTKWCLAANSTDTRLNTSRAFPPNSVYFSLEIVGVIKDTLTVAGHDEDCCHWLLVQAAQAGR